MLGAVNLMKGPLKIPTKFIPYLETHRIYELFHEIATQLVIKKPSNHISYIKQCLNHAARCRDSPKIILFAPPNFDKNSLAEYIEKKIGIHRVTLENISTTILTAEVLANNVRNILRERYSHNESGWIFTNCSSTTHNTAKSYESVRNPCGNTNKSQNCDDYNSKIRDLRETYANILITVETAGRTYEELGNACITLAKRQRNFVPCIFRLILIGSRGSGRRCVANYLSRAYGLVHIDFDYLLEQTRQQNSSLGETLRCIERQWGLMPQADTRIKVVENKLMTHDCIKRGWVLTGYPITVEDFKLLDLLTTPPNRIILLNVNQTICRERLLSRRFDIINGSEYHLPLNENFQTHSVYGLTVHPKDYRSKVEQDLQEYEENIGALLEYAGESVEVVNGVGQIRAVCEKVEACLVRPIARTKLRISKLLKNIDSMKIEFDPDDDLDELDSRISDEVRAKESIYSLV
ncbi:hypothetical protein PV327_005752 [Microctonus hyperodae]|uniref:Adenylate kinase 8 n=1 Tax=Microctonus hyperodae TaxID=165561 RepID=A0AA39L062_MICHY|nr:hypothetical protein PV327_005752 [Microctonus hyperodae]